jgi:putative SOS response-associated peptidase YedK
VRQRTALEEPLGKVEAFEADSNFAILTVNANSSIEEIHV